MAELAPTKVVSVTPPAPRPAAPTACGLADLRAVLTAAELPLPPAPPPVGPGPDAAAPAGPGLDAVVRGVTHDSRRVAPGDLYAALPGAHVHGADFAAAAIARGAVAVLTDAEGARRIAAAGGPAAALPVLVSADPRRDLAPVAARVHGDPSAALRLLGVTGTNGKTTTAFLLDAGLRAAGHTTGLVGTVETRIAGDRLASVHTTPEASDLQALLATMVERGVDAATMEVSSHALAQHRADALHFAGALFTNLSQDHLDFHPTMADYFEAKASLFTPGRAAAAVIGVGDEWGRRLAARRPDAVTFAVDGPADWTARDITAGPTGSELLAAGPGGERVELSVPLPGLFNIANALGALALLVAVGVDPAVAAAGIGSLPGVPGRMERVDAGQPFLALVDFAHTPDAVTTLLATVRPLVKGRIIIVLGCGGDRDRGKRPLMGAAAATLADLAILTNDNPRSEDPADIIAAMLAGVPATARAAGRVLVEPDRAAAIAAAVAAAGPQDAVVVAGKGHESGQEQAGLVTPFDDRAVLRAALDAAARG
ncbi:UDP-N-acetylmuramoylalanyl-D-glutamate--2,6-diaminopimelate ligase [Frankia torreyi]|uniref:UDP-N-acetylmuramoyl-L-alanyl-D-glutamate--2,6-diaminopimelate ligase n=1 Tax=Frankia torreyi TaxID=1856 RepID=A0A0D8BLF5_9ACTN|nr:MULTISPECIES: UDP-N-acetylmuramoyl-L-alanyl-D-glutamate--2,6-diaminopimelate ligase [Frankia]KJE24819.1 UDP-N-acetylmuramoylalanyl-D-glutamate--2,6-diaminopimelate ligase [Frankia torreyi]KQM07011.1 UDP-N-acetylmuramoylalanyl-D-glutamate--2,6-diaminopimelate ligase [Frankia sp. CpI1-P]